MSPTATTATASGLLQLGGDLPVHRLGYGAMQLTGEGVWGEPSDPAQALAVLRRAVELGVDLIDTADAYGPFVSEDLIREALHTGGADPYDGVVVATKGGLTRTGPGEWHQCGRPEYLGQCVEMSLRRLDVETIDLYQLHRIDDSVPIAEQLGALTDLQQAGKIRHLGLSEVTVDQLREAQQHATVVSVQNRFNLLDRGSQDVLDVCEADGIGFIPWFPIATGDLAGSGGPLDPIAEATGARPSQLALAWLLATSPVTLPIPGTSKVAHLEENVAAAEIELTDDVVAQLDALGS